MLPGDPSLLDTLDHAFRLLASEPTPLTLHGGAVGRGLPARPIPLLELRSMLLHPSTGFAARHPVVEAHEMVERADHIGSVVIDIP